MAVSGYEFVQGPFQNVRFLIEENDKLFKEQIIPKGGPDQHVAAVSRIIKHRNWEPTQPLIEANLLPVLKELNIFFVPKQLNPGPCIVFPNYDTHGEPVRGKIRPLGWELVVKNTPARYGMLGLNFEFSGPTWLGNSRETLERIIRTKTVFLVEGPFDLLACRVLYPDAPVLSTGTKAVSEKHFMYLKALGVRKIVFLFDNDLTADPNALGAGKQAAQTLTKIAVAKYGFRAEMLLCYKQDPSKCLEQYQAAIKLKNALVMATAA